MEIAAMARLYRVRAEDLLASGEPESIESLVVSRYRAVTGQKQDPAIMATLHDLIETCRDVRRIEAQVEPARLATSLPKYELPVPASTWECIHQAQALAAQERARLQLGDQPIFDVVGLFLASGLRVWSYELPRGTSGLYFGSPATGPVIVVNKDDTAERRVFSYAHEYCHALVDRDRGAVVSIHDDKDPVERRADIFAIHFLAPETGVRAYLAQNASLIADESPAFQIALVARHFGTSYESTGYHLLNAKIITKPEHEASKSDNMRREAIARVKALQGPMRRAHDTPPISQWVTRTCVLGVQKGVLTRAGAEELCERVGVSAAQFESALHPKTTNHDDSFY